MSIFGADLISRPVLTQEMFDDLMKNTFLGCELINHDGPLVVWQKEGDEVDALLRPHIQRVNTRFYGMSLACIHEIVLEDQLLSMPPILLNNNHRYFISLDCSILAKWDTVGFLSFLSRLNPECKPIVIINNFTEIPRIGGNIDNPEDVANWLLFLWQNNTIELVDKAGIPFTVYPKNYTVIVPIKRSTGDYLFGKIGVAAIKQMQFEKKYSDWMTSGFATNYVALKEKGVISELQAIAVEKFLQKDH